MCFRSRFISFIVGEKTLGIEHETGNKSTFVLHPYKLVKDVRTDYETSNAQAVLDGELDPFIKPYLMEYGG